MKKIFSILISLHLSLFTIHLLAQSCLPEGIEFETQSQIDSFQVNYPGCTEIEGGYVVIGGDDISNLNGLSVLTSIGGNLMFGIVGWDDGNCNPALENLSGLNNLTSIGGHLYIFGAESLINLTGLENLTFVGGGLNIGYQGGFGFYIPENSSLISLTGLDNLTYVGGYLGIYRNPTLISLTGLGNLTFIGEHLQIIANSSLSTCEVQSICDYLASSNGSVWIEDNAPGCNSPEEVDSLCNIVTVQEINFKETFTISPNPLRSNAVITYTLNESSHINLKIFDLSGQLVATLVNEYQQQGEQKIEFNSTGLSAGIYFCTLKTTHGIQTTKLIKH